jgi:hypothetical protein
VQTLFNRENYKLCKGGPQIWKIKRYIGNGVRKKFLNLNIENIGAKKGFKHVLTRICVEKCFVP